ncbi:MAG: SPOR domain-containing protein [Candidatus Aminicenantes bacterium]|nr:SPOR domain-containing protein [Candidatus Aminicenantes bacterium]
MANKDYRELQLSSSQLVLIFVAILVLGVIIFLLGVSVGKKQAQIADTSQITTEPITEKVEEEVPQPIEETTEQLDAKAATQPSDTITEELASHKKAREEAQKESPPALSRNLYYIQVGAYKNKESAYSVADRLKDLGFSSLVRDPSPSDSRGLYKVWVGGFETRVQADGTMTDLAKAEGKKKTDYFIVKH